MTQEPQEVTEATTKYRCEQDVVRAFYDECCAVSDTTSATVGETYAAYKLWAELGGEKKPLGKVRFNARLEGHGFKKAKRNTGLVWEGLAVHDAYIAKVESEKVKR